MPIVTGKSNHIYLIDILSDRGKHQNKRHWEYWYLLVNSVLKQIYLTKRYKNVNDIYSVQYFLYYKFVYRRTYVNLFSWSIYIVSLACTLPTFIYLGTILDFCFRKRIQIYMHILIYFHFKAYIGTVQIPFWRQPLYLVSLYTQLLLKYVDTLSYMQE